MQGLSSPFVIHALEEVITGGAGNSNEPPIGIYRSGTAIKKFFMGCGVEMSIGSMQSRLSATQETLHDLMHRENGVAAIERIITTVADPRYYETDPSKGVAVIEHLNRVLEVEGFVLSIVNGKAALLTKQGGSVTVSAIATKTALLDFDTVQRDIERSLQSVDDAS